MTKKDFSKSPLMAFVTKPEQGTPEDAPAEAAEEQGKGSAASRKDVHSTDTPETKATAKPERRQRKPAKDTAEAKERGRIAKRNARFRSAPPTPPEYFAKPDTEEARSRRVQLLIKPSIYREIRNVANQKRQSINNLMEQILTDYLNTADQRGEE